MEKALQYKIQRQEIGDVQDQVEDGEEEGESTLAYLKMPAMKYYCLTLILYAICILGAIFVEDIAIIFDFIGGFGFTFAAFTFPALFYLFL